MAKKKKKGVMQIPPLTKEERQRMKGWTAEQKQQYEDERRARLMEAEDNAPAGLKRKWSSDGEEEELVLSNSLKKAKRVAKVQELKAEDPFVLVHELKTWVDETATLGPGSKDPSRKIEDRMFLLTTFLSNKRKKGRLTKKKSREVIDQTFSVSNVPDGFQALVDESVPDRLTFQLPRFVMCVHQLLNGTRNAEQEMMLTQVIPEITKVVTKERWASIYGEDEQEADPQPEQQPQRNEQEQPPLIETSSFLQTEFDKYFMDSEEDEEDENQHKKDPYKQPTFTKQEVSYDDFAPESQTSVVGEGIRSMLQQRQQSTNNNNNNDSSSSSKKDKASQFISVEEFDPRKQDKTNENASQPAQADEDIFSGQTAPWCRSKNSNRMPSGVLRLHNEILDFCKLIEERPEERASRESNINAIQQVIKELWPNATYETFGSYTTGLCIPSSDVDMVLFGAPDNAIHKLAAAFRKKNMVGEMEVISKARIPIIKIRLATSKYWVDISFGVEGGVETSAMIHKLLAEIPPLKPLTLLVKYFLAQRSLNETYLGGIGSHLCLCMVVCSIQQYRKYIYNAKRSHDRVEDLEDLGSLFLDFLDFYGRRLNYDKVAITLRDGGKFMEKPQRFVQNRNKPGILCIENPEDPDSDLGASSYNMWKIRKAFAHAHRLILDRLASKSLPKTASILEAVISVDETLKSREL